MSSFKLTSLPTTSYQTSEQSQWMKTEISIQISTSGLYMEDGVNILSGVESWLQYVLYCRGICT